MAKHGRVALVVGASSGMGKACAEYLHAHGYSVYGTSRRADYPTDDSYRKVERGFLVMIPLDVTAEASIQQAVDFVLAKEGEINLLLNCAGFALGGAVEDISREEAREVFETNFFGMMSCCQKVLPAMRAQHGGLIVNISSVAGFIALPFQSMYSASKYAVEAMTEALRMEVRPFGIKVAMIDPGDVNTGFTAARRTAKAALTNPVYRERHQKAVDEMVRSETGGPGPHVVVKEFARILASANPPIRRIVGAQYKAVAVLKRILPATVVERIVEKIY